MRSRLAHAAFIVGAFVLAGCQLPYTGGAKPVSPNTIDSSWLQAAPTPVIRQGAETDCGLAALAMMANAWGVPMTVGALQHELHPDDNGVKLGALRDVARKHDLDAYAVKASTDDLVHELQQHRPVLLGLVLPFDREHNRNHYEVAVAMDPRDGKVVTIDPASGNRMERSRAVLDIEWKAAGYAALVVVGKTGGGDGKSAPATKEE